LIYKDIVIAEPSFDIHLKMTQPWIRDQGVVIYNLISAIRIF